MHDSLFYRKNVSADPSSEGLAMRRTLGLWDLIFLGIGSIMGTGVFVLTGKGAVHAGPGVMLSFVLAAFCAALSAMCYAEMAGMLPVSGSAYLYAYATLGEVVAFTLGWAMLLMYLIGAATLGAGWSGYMVSLVEHLGLLQAAPQWTQAPVAWISQTQELQLTGAYANLPAASIILAVAALLNRGVAVSARVTTVIVAVKVAVVLMFVAWAWPHVQVAHWQPLVPPNRGTFGDLGPSGVLNGAMLLFFAYMGFDAISAAAAESRRPARDMPLSILVSLSVCACLYVAVAAALTGLVPYTELNVPYPLALGARAIGAPWLETVVDVGATVGLTSVLLSQLYVLPRIIMAMAHDRLLPPALTHTHRHNQVPHRLTWAMATLAAAGAALLPMDTLAELTSVGILLVFAVVAVGVSVQRLRNPQWPRRFRVPLGPYVVPGCTVALCAGLIGCASRQAMTQLLVWMALGLIIYLTYSRARARAYRIAQPDTGSIS